MAVVITPALLMLWLHKLFKEIYKLPCPVTAIHMDGEWAILHLKPHLMRVPSLNTQRVATQGFYNSNGKRINIAVWDMPEFFFHGTSVEGLLGTLRDGIILGSHEIGEPPKKPAGVYSYGNSDRSDVSTYVAQGAQIRFRSPSIAPSAANCSLFPTVPEGLINYQAGPLGLPQTWGSGVGVDPQLAKHSGFGRQVQIRIVLHALGSNLFVSAATH